MDFLQSDCNKAALIICSNGSAIIAELLRLGNYIPDVFLFKTVVDVKTKKTNYYNPQGTVLDP